MTENTRVSYPIDHIEKIVRPVSAAPAAKNVIFLSADAFGVLPPVSILTPEQTEYYFLSGFTAKLAGSIKTAPTKTIPYFNFEVPTELPGVDPKILDPRDTYADAAQWDEKAKDLASRFQKNFVKYESNEAGKALVAAGPQL